MKIVSDTEATMEAVLPLLVTDVMHALEVQGKHPEEDFPDRLRNALLIIVPLHPQIEEEVWQPDNKKKIVEEICREIKL